MLKRFCEKHNIFYGWVMVVCGVLVMAVTHGIIANCFSLYIKPVTEELGITRQSFSVCQTITNVVYMLISLLSGKIFEKIKVKNLLRVAAVVLPASYFCYSFCTELWMFYTVATVAGIATAFLTFLPFTLIVSNWFEEKRGLAIGLCFMGSGVGGMLFNTLASGWMENMGWQMASRLLALCIALVAIPIIFFVLKVRPQEMGLQPFGSRADKGAKETPVYGADFKTALRMPGFWGVLIFALTVGFAATTLSNTIVPHLGDLGFTASRASMVMSLYLGGLSICKILLGGMYDKLGMKKATVLATLAVAMGHAGLLLGSFGAAHVLIILGAALGCAVGTVAYPILTQSAFGTRGYTTIYGVISAANSLACSIAPIFSSAMYDGTGSYNAALITCIVFVGIALSMLLIIKPIRRKEITAD